MTSGRQAHGRYGEERAARWYQAAGYTVVDRNWRGGGGELDLVVSRPGLVVFVEVKARSSAAFGTAAEAVTPAKQAKVRQVARAWLAAHPVRERRDLRFDVVTVTSGRLEVIEAAF